MKSCCRIGGYVNVNGEHVNSMGKGNEMGNVEIDAVPSHMCSCCAHVNFGACRVDGKGAKVQSAKCSCDVAYAPLD